MGRLSSELVRRIRMSGPLTVAEYMRLCLTHPTLGYYTTRSNVLGAAGDFTTAPEVSQMFGEMVAVWCASMWATSIGGPFDLLELGPGRGTLVRDVLRCFELWNRRGAGLLDAVHIRLVEASPVLRLLQKELLYPWIDRIRWYNTLEEVPIDRPIIAVAQEFFDALPVHQFVKTDRGWCERLVDIDEGTRSPCTLRYVLSRGATEAVETYKASLDAIGVDAVEISPEAMSTIGMLCDRIGSDRGKGATLVVDYGKVPENPLSLRGIRAHRQEHSLAHPGDADLSVDVDFATLIRCSKDRGNVRCYGPVSQSSFLRSMGIDTRLDRLIAENQSNPDIVSTLRGSFQRLMNPDEMGSIYKCIALTHPDNPEPQGFSQ